jgi:hypothetical protein
MAEAPVAFVVAAPAEPEELVKPVALAALIALVQAQEMVQAQDLQVL